MSEEPTGTAADGGEPDDEGTLTFGDRWTYRWADRKKPAIHPLRSPAGHVLTRMQPADHPWHRALWFAIKYLDDENFWEEVPPYGVQRHREEPTVTGPAADGRTTVEGTLVWTRPDRTTTALEERRRLTHVPLGDGAYAIDLDTRLMPAADVTFRSEPFTTWGGYGGLSLRGRADWHDTRLLLADGSAHERVIGEPSPWCDLSGPVGEGDGDVAGIAILDHPGNPRHPVPWYGSTRAATYGDEGWSNFLNAAFLFHEPMSLAAGEQLRLRHRVIVHDGAWGVEEVGAAHDAWVNEAKSATATRRSAHSIRLPVIVAPVRPRPRG